MPFGLDFFFSVDGVIWISLVSQSVINGI